MDALEVYTKEISETIWLDLKKSTTKNIQKKDKKLESTFAKMISRLNVATQMVRLIGAIFYAWLIVFNFPKLVGFFSNPATVVFYIHL